MVYTNDLRYFPHIISESEDEIISEFKYIDELVKFPLKDKFGLNDGETWNNIETMFIPDNLRIYLKFKPKLSTQDSGRFNMGFEFTDEQDMVTRWFDMNGMLVHE